MTTARNSSRAPWQPCTAAGWQQVQVKRSFVITLGKMLQNAPAAASDQEVPYLKAQHVQWDGVKLEDLPTMWASPAEIDALSVRSGDLLVCEGGEVGRARVLAEDPPARTIIQNALHLVRGRSGQDTRYLAYVLRHAATNGWFDVLCNRSTIAHFTVEKFGEMWAWIPPTVVEQRAIADYLDRETARIDALIAAKERVLELLAEKRRALITRAVTRGLDPHAPLRDSGIPWLGEIPAHWEVLPIKYGFATIGSGTTPPSGKTEYYEGDFPWVTTSELRENIIHETSQSVTLLAMREFTALRHYAPGSVLVAMYGATTGRVAMLGVAATVNQAVCVLSDARRLLPAFAFYSLQASRNALTSEALGGGQPNLNAEKVKNHRLACPSLPEQKAITEHIERGTKKLDELSAFTTRTIELLRERRCALIAAAVTGQIDIRQTLSGESASESGIVIQRPATPQRKQA